MTLPTVEFGRTGLRASRLGYGAMEMRGPQAWGEPISDDQARTVIAAELDDRPRRIHDFRRPAEVCADLIKDGDALTPCARRRLPGTQRP
ncbi:hypothetical protein [Streptosporangium minutum]|uniref:Uncharacterized protein n=1 Tax=Streptosporangium minutum TaxID=569862 RepID=A0A243RAJ2_9ACTN|nr:hypothetical protein [Streptosporangium minutum]OUC91662.1 hypothetical protein CA984_32820 [Streptosporangium minutum]